MEPPRTVDVVPFAAARMLELRALQADVDAAGLALVPPRHMRRRAASHARFNATTRRPNAVRAAAKKAAAEAAALALSVQDRGEEPGQAAPCDAQPPPGSPVGPPLGRPARRRLAAKAGHSTLRWHAKRFTTATPWPRGAPLTRVAVALFGRRRGGRALLRAVGAWPCTPKPGRQARPRAGCALHDVGAYHVAFQLHGTRAALRRVIAAMAPRARLTGDLLAGRRPLKCVLHAHQGGAGSDDAVDVQPSPHGAPGTVICPALVLWQPMDGSSQPATARQGSCLLWVHAAAAGEAEAALRAACGDGDAMTEGPSQAVTLARRNDLYRFDLVGAGADDAVCAVTRLCCAETAASEAAAGGAALPEWVGGFAVPDPRVVRPVTAPPRACNCLGLWDPAARAGAEYRRPLGGDTVNAALAALRMRELSTFVPPPVGSADTQAGPSTGDTHGQEMWPLATVVLLLRRPPTRGKPWSGGWSVIGDVAWARPVWNALATARLTRRGAHARPAPSDAPAPPRSGGAHVHVAGQAEWHTLASAAGASVFPEQWLDTAAGVAAHAARHEQQRLSAALKPVGKRLPHLRRLPDAPLPLWHGVGDGSTAVHILRTCPQFVASTHGPAGGPDAKHAQQRRATLSQARLAWLAAQGPRELEGGRPNTPLVRVRLDLPVGGHIREGAHLHSLLMAPDGKAAMTAWRQAAGQLRSARHADAPDPATWVSLKPIGAILGPLPPPSARPVACTHALMDAHAFWTARVSQHAAGARGGGPIRLLMATGEGVKPALAWLCVEDSADGDDTAWW
jgi:hypothetical protein